MEDAQSVVELAGFPIANLFGRTEVFFFFEQQKVGLLVFQQRKVLLE